jgi:peptidoglycan-associated lipoprotein
MNWKTLLTATAMASLLAACASTPTSKLGDQPAATTTNSNASGSAPIVSSSSQNQPVADPLNDPSSPLAKRSVFFDFDSYVVKSEFKPTVSAHAEYLKSNAAHKVVIQGNTDARGSREYNLGLGQRRAESVKQAMQVLGVPEKQLEAVSLGKEKLRATGGSEADDAQNRRADIVYDAQ